MEAAFAREYPPFRSNQQRTTMEPQAQVTLLLRNAKNGDGEALDLLIPIVYDELRRLAAHYLRDERAAETLQPTSLVHEAYMRLVAQDTPEWECRAHFYGVAAQLMRQILVDHARRHRSQKRGGGVAPVTLDEAVAFAPGKSDDVLALDDALTSLAAVDARKCRIIELRYFAGFSVDDTGPRAQRLGRHDWARTAAGRGVAASRAVPPITMNAERWQAIGELFEQALPLPVGERTVLLDSACGSMRSCDARSCHCWRATTPAVVFLNIGSRRRSRRSMTPASPAHSWCASVLYRLNLGARSRRYGHRLPRRAGR